MKFTEKYNVIINEARSKSSAVAEKNKQKRFGQLIKKFEKKMDVAWNAMGVRVGMSELWWYKHGQPLSDIIDDLYDNHNEAYKKYADKKGWVSSRPSVGDLMA